MIDEHWDSTAVEFGAAVRRMVDQHRTARSRPGAREQTFADLQELGLFDLLPGTGAHAAKDRFAAVVCAGRELLDIQGSETFWTAGIAARLVGSICALNDSVTDIRPSPDATVALQVGGGRTSTVAARCDDAGAQWSVTGRVDGVFGVDKADHVLVEALVDDGRYAIVLAPARAEQTCAGEGWTGEPVQSIEWTGESATAVLVGSRSEIALHRDTALAWAATLQNSQLIGIARACVTLTEHYVQDRRQFGRPLASQPVVRAHVADAEMHLLVAESVAGAALGCLYRSPAPPTSDDIGFLALARLSVLRRTHEAVMIANRLTGGVGYYDDYPLAGLTRALLVHLRLFGAASQWRHAAETYATGPTVLNGLGAAQNPRHFLSTSS